jgi:hypothetical protein
MPLRWKIAPLDLMVVCVAEGVVTYDDLTAYFAALDAAGASHYRRILDATHAENRLSELELARLVAHARSLGWSGAPGPMAVVTGSAGNEGVVADVRAMLRTGRRMREFRTIHEARKWLEGEEPGRPA